MPLLHGDFTQLVISAFTMHNQQLPPPVPAPNVPGLVEGPATMGWPPGFIAHKQAMTVFIDGAPGIKQGHDVGYMIPHFALPPNALMAVNTMFSKHKVIMPISSVKLQDKTAGTYLFFLLGEICANPCSMPTGVVLLLRCTVFAGFNWKDLLKGLGYIVIDAVFDLIWNKIFKGNFLGKSLKDAEGKAIKGILTMPKIKDPVALKVLDGLSLGEMVFWGGGGLVARTVLIQMGNKALDHVIKSWIVSPAVSGLPRGQSKVGRGDYEKPFFDAKWW
jgi:hypothetical protein